MEPEISHRCPSCGAAVRGAAMFCPQCGRTLKGKEAEAGEGAAASVPEAPARRSTDGNREAPAVAPADITTVAHVGDAPPAEELPRRQRVTSAAREAVEGKIGPRVEKLRHASNVVLEEASYDPSLRFVLIALAVFLVSLLLLLLNYILG